MPRRRSIQYVEEDERGGQAILFENHPDDCFDSDVVDREECTEVDSKHETKVHAMCTRCGKFPQSTHRGVRKGLCCNKCPNHGPWCSGHTCSVACIHSGSVQQGQPGTWHQESPDKKRVKIVGQHSSKFPKPGHGDSINGDVLFEDSSNKDELATTRPDYEDQTLRNLLENSLDEKEDASTPVLSNRARRLLVPKAAARPPVGLLQRMAKRREEMKTLQRESIHTSPSIQSSHGEGGFGAEATDPPCCANPSPTETASPAKEAIEIAATDSPVASTRGTQASMQLLDRLATMNLVKENQLPPQTKQPSFGHPAGPFAKATRKKLGFCRTRTPLANMDMNAMCLRC
jgi:hypothetical protein